MHPRLRHQMDALDSPVVWLLLLGGVVALVVTALSSGCATPCPTPAPVVAAPTYTPYPTLAPLPTYTPYPTYTAVPAPTTRPTVAATATTASKIGARSQPAPWGQAFTIKEKDFEVTMKLAGVLRHAEADAKINTGAVLKSSPQDGQEFYMAQVSVDYLAGDKDKAVTFEYNDWSIDVQDTLRGATVSIHKEILKASLYPGGKTTGYVLFQIPKGTEPRAVRYRKFLADTEYWFALK